MSSWSFNVDSQKGCKRQVRGPMLGASCNVAQHGAWSESDLVWYPESVSRGISMSDIKMRSIRDIVECDVEKQEYARVSGCLHLQVSVSENSVSVWPNLVVLGWWVLWFNCNLSLWGLRTILKSPSQIPGTLGCCAMYNNPSVIRVDLYEGGCNMP